MEDFTLNEVLEMQRKLQENYKGRWQPIGPETGKSKLLWMIGEIGEVMLCYGITPGELKQAYIEKSERNMTRWKKNENQRENRGI